MLSAIGELLFLAGLASLAGFVGWVVYGIVSRRRRLSMAAIDTCLLCDSERLTSLGESDYRCEECGFDTGATADQSRDLEHFRDIKNSLFELEQAREKLQQAKMTAVISGDASRDLVSQATTHQSNALAFLRGFTGREPEFLDVPFSSEYIGDMPRSGGSLLSHMRELAELVTAARESTEDLDAYIVMVTCLRDALRQKILSPADVTDDEFTRQVQKAIGDAFEIIDPATTYDEQNH